MSNKVIELLYLAKQNGIEILLADDQLKVRFPKNKEIDRSLLNEIKESKSHIVEFLKDKKKQNNLNNKISKVQKDANILMPLSFSQERLWFIDSLEGSQHYHIPAIFRLKGKLNKEALQYSLKEIIRRHEILRTVYLEKEGEPYQNIIEPDAWELKESDFQLHKDDNVKIKSFIQELISAPFDLKKDYMIRVNLIKLDEEESILVVVLHHIAADGWSVSVLVKEFSEIYSSYESGRDFELPPLNIQYSDYADWQRKFLQGEVLEQKISYWKNKLEEVTPLQLPTDFPRPAVQSSRGSAVTFKIEKSLTAELKFLSKQNESTLFMTLLAALNVLLSRYSSQADICIGTGTAGRIQQELDNLIGFFINTIALRNEIKPDISFSELLKQVRKNTLDDFEHQDVPFEKVVEAVETKRDRSRHPVFQVMFVFQNLPDTPEFRLGELQVSAENSEHTTSLFDLSIAVTENNDGLSGSVEYSSDLFTEDTVLRMVNHFNILLESIVKDPQKEILSLQMMTKEEEDRLLIDFNATETDYPSEKSIIEIFEEQVVKTPDAIAVTFEDQSLTYSQLNERSNQLGHYLKNRGVKDETPVAVCIERSLELVTGILGILKAGGVYVPVDPDFPQERIQFMLDDSASKIVITSNSIIPQLPQADNIDFLILDEKNPDLSSQPLSNPGSHVKPENLAYIIYTSGSTGTPKGVMVTNRNVVSLVKGVSYVTLKENDVLLSTGSSSFDATTIEYWGMLLNGGQLVLCREKNLLESELLKKEIISKKVNRMWFTSSWFNELVETDVSIFKTLDTVIAGGEKLSAYHIEKLRQTYPHIEIINGYGPTENTTFSLTYKITETKLIRNIPIGRPLDNRKAYILDEFRNPVPIGVTGEIYLSGAGLSRGYLNNPELTEQKFVKNLFSDRSNSVMYKTGDLGCWLPDGIVEYLGRKDEQIKIRGYRIELGEIESVLQDSEMVSQAAVIVREDEDGNKTLAAYVIPADSYDRHAVLKFMRNRLPEYMIPLSWLEVDHFKLTPNGKIDKRALPEIEDDGKLRNIYIAPRNETEEILVSIWQRVLRLERVGVEDNFFDLGGHSLLAMRLISAIRKELNTEIEVKELFTYPVISELSDYIQNKGNSSLLPSVEVIKEKPEYIPLSFSQERLWFIDKLEGSLEYNLPTVLRLKGKINVDALENSIRQIINRHEVLRTVIKEKDGQGYQKIIDADSWKLKIIDRPELKKDNDGLKRFIQNLVSRPFDLTCDFMLRAELIHIDENENIFVVTMHHIASDAWSMSIIVKEFMELYSSYTGNRNEELLPVKIQYSDYAMWQRKFLEGEELEKKLSYWKTKLGDASTLHLPTDFSRPAVKSNRGAFEVFRVDQELTDRLYELGREHGSTLFMTLLSVFKVLLYRYSGQNDITVGTSITNRPQQELEDLIGFFVNTLALHSDVRGEATFSRLLQDVKTTTLEAYAHQDVPFEKVVDAVVTDRDPGKSPVFQVMLVLHNTPEISRLSLGDLEIIPETVEYDVSKFEITFFFDETPKGLIGTVQYRTDLYTPQTIRRMTNHFNELLKSIVKDPDQKIGKLQILTDEEKFRLTEEINTSAVIYPKDKSIVDLFEEQAEKNPDNIALVFEDKRLTYRELNELSNQLAHNLRKKRVNHEKPVPLYAERGIDMMIGILGILKSGAAYVPVDTDFPMDRVNYMLEDTRASLIVCSKESKSKLNVKDNVEVIEIKEFNDEPKENLQTRVSPHNLAYVIYTSGSTGKPKGVMIEHRSLVDYVFGLNDKIQINDCRSFALVSTIATDLGNTVIYSSLVSGGELHLFTKESISNTEYIHRYFNNHRIDCLKIVPSHWQALMVDEKLLIPEKLLIFGGEALHSELIKKIKLSGSDCSVVNHYGPTETTIGKLLYITEADTNYINTIPIGKPFSNTRVYVLSKDKELCPAGVHGQLYISGDGLARGYYNNEELTREKFVENPFDTVYKVDKVHKVCKDDEVEKDGKAEIDKIHKGSECMYGTGDLVKYLPDGNILFLGRADDQVKIRGYRIELGEIESILQQNEFISQAAVLAKEDKQGNKRLIAYIVSDKESKEFDKNKIISWLKEKVPDYMAPSLIIELEQFPITANGKIDRNALPDPDFQGAISEGYVAPRNEAESKLVEIWKDILEVDQVGINDDFFDLGGHSLLAVRLISLIRKQFKFEMPIGDIFDYPTIAQLSQRLESKFEDEVLPAIELRKRPEKIPLSFSQDRLWFIDKLEGSVQYHVPSVLRLKGKLNEEALKNSLAEIISRHEVLRTVIKQEGSERYQHIQSSENWKLNIIEGSKYKDDPQALRAFTKSLINSPFDLSGDYMLRSNLIKLDEDDYLLVTVLHHIASDGWSTSIIVKELVELYEAFEAERKPGLEPLPLQYADFAVWQRDYLREEVLDKRLDYWKNKLAEVEPLQLPADFKRGSVQSIKGAFTGFFIDEDLTDKLQKLSQQSGTTLYMTFLAAFKVLLYRHSGQSDICVGTSIAGRRHQELEKLIGFFLNTLPLRDSLNDDITFTELLNNVKQTAIEAYSYQDVPFEKIVDAVVKERDTGRSPLVQVMFEFQNTPSVPPLRLGETSILWEGYEHTTSQFDMTISITQRDNGINVAIYYCSDLFSDQTMMRMGEHFQKLLKAIVVNPGYKISDLPMMTDSETNQILVEFNSNLGEYPVTENVVGLFEKQAQQTPKAAAVIFGSEQITYSELNEKSNKLANYLKQAGVRKEDAIPICIDRGINMIIGILGILKAGAAYVPIDPEYPDERIKYMLENINSSIILVSKESKSKLPAEKNFEFIDIDEVWLKVKKRFSGNLNEPISQKDLAYIIYTSGSTGKPKGVMIEHKGLVNMTLSQIKLLGLKPGMNVLQFATFTFDASCSEIFTTLLSGGRLIMTPKEDLLSEDFLGEIIKSQKIDVVTLPPSYQELVKKDLSDLKNLISAGEKLNGSLAKELQEKGVRVFNAYGPTENTVCVSMTDNPVLPDGTVTIGKPIHNVKVYILDNKLNPVPVGVPGELCAGGIQVARGYLNSSELTNEKFIKNPFSQNEDERIYKTGDLARWLNDGSIEYLGRTDDQIKVSGYRIEYGEIESVMKAHPLVKEAAVVYNETKGNGNLVAFYTPGVITELWPSIAEFFIYDDVVYRSMYEHKSRNEKYREAIKKVIKDKIVLEIGPGPEAVLSRLCLECGAKHVYAVEILEETYNKARKYIEEMGLTDKITLIHSDIRNVNLPEKADYCVSEIVGSIGGSEGSAVLIDFAKRFLKDESHMIPSRSLTKISAVTVDKSLDYGFSEVARNYAEKIIENFGADFEFRLCLKNLPKENIISTHNIFEDLDYTGKLDFEHKHEINLTITKDSVFNGFYIWMDLYLDRDTHFDILEDQGSWLPIFFPAVFPGIKVKKGEQIVASISRKLSSNKINPDYFVEGKLYKSDGSKVDIKFDSYHHEVNAKRSEFFEKLFQECKLKPLTKLDVNSLREYLSEYLPSYMIPSGYVTLDKIPLMPSGKVNRKKLMKMEVNLTAADRYVAPRNEIEKLIADIWKDLLEVDQVGIRDDFFELGGHSLLAVKLFSYLEKLTGKSLALNTLFDSPTIESLVKILKNEEWIPKWKSLVPIQPNGTKLPFFYVPPAAATALSFQGIIKYIPTDQPVYFLESLGMDGKEKPHNEMKEMASYYIKEIQSLQPEGPYLIGGRCFGGRVAYEMAQQLLKAGQKVALLAIFDTWPPYVSPQTNKEKTNKENSAKESGSIVQRSIHHLKTGEFMRVARNYIWLNYMKKKREWKNKINYIFSDSKYKLYKRIEIMHFKAQDNYIASKYPGKITLIECGTYRAQNREGWRNLALGGFENYSVPDTTHETIMKAQNIGRFAEKLNFILEKAHKETKESFELNGKVKFYPRKTGKEIESVAYFE